MERGRLPGAIAALLLAATPLVAWERALGADDACTREPERAWCSWTITVGGGIGDWHTFVVPSYTVALARLVVAFNGNLYAGYAVNLSTLDGELIRWSESGFASSSRITRDLVEEESFLVDWPRTREDLALNFRGRSGDAPSESAGEYRLTWLARPLPEGRTPERPPATLDDPHLADDHADAHPAAYDIVAFWFDDERIGDELFEAHLAVASLAEEPPEGAAWTARFRVADRVYNLSWARTEDGYSCELESSQPDFDTAGLRVGMGSTTYEPRCDRVIGPEIGTFSAQLPVAWVGSPPDGEPFTIEGVYSQSPDPVTVASGPRLVDVARDERYPFALGDERVWDEMNPRLAVVRVPVPWYRDPLAPENVADSLQVAGAILASATFLGGFVIVRRRRARAKRLLDEVDAVASRHGGDARAGLMALGRLETRIDASYRNGDITEGEYQLVSQRIATTAARLAIRATFGLDDGRPDATPVVTPRTL